MTSKTIGYVELEWSCPNCGNKNPGQKKTCATCGSPQPENVQFEAGDKRDLITDAQKAASAAKAPDIHCPYCHTRNPADAQVCVQCGGDLKEGLHRESGRVISVEPANVNAPVKCPGCGKLNPSGRDVAGNVCSFCGILLNAPPLSIQKPGSAPVSKSSPFRPWMMLPIGGILMLVCVIIGFLFFRTTAISGIVQSTQWQRSIAIQEQRQVTKQDWRDQVPGGANILSCQQQYRSRQDNPAPGAKEVCSTKMIDQGNGAAKVEESCYYEVYADYCKYQALEWQTVNQAQAQGADLKPYWPQFNPANGQREGGRTETYTASFQTKDGVKQYTTDNAAMYAQFLPGSEWLLSVNTLGAVLDVSQP